MTSKELKGKILTVRGTIAPEQLGRTLMHEHVFCDLNPPGSAAPLKSNEEITLQNIWDIRHHWCKHADNCRLDDAETAVRELQDLRNAGGRSLVELTSVGMQPNPHHLKAVSEKTGLNIVMGSGYYIEEHLSAGLHEKPVEALTLEMVNLIRNGDGHGRIRAGIIGEIGCSTPWTGLEKRIMHAAVVAQIETGAALSVHPPRYASAPLEVVGFIKDLGGDPQRTIIGHIDRTIFDVDTLLGLADSGCMIEFDFFGIESTFYPFKDIDLPNDGTRLKMLRALIERGFLSQILISQDICTKTRLRSWGGHGYGYLFSHVLPLMTRRGFSEAEIKAILVANPRRLLTFW